jgi:hypothetical protein
LVGEGEIREKVGLMTGGKDPTNTPFLLWYPKAEYGNYRAIKAKRIDPPLPKRIANKLIKRVVAVQQITINFQAGPVELYGSCREYVASLVYQQGKPQKAIAADMDYSPSDLSRKLSQHPDDSRRFTLDDLERFIEVTGDTKPVLYLIEKYLACSDPKRLAELEAEVARLRAKQGRRL